jgi:putative heme-binding domain-containing protein
LLTFSANKQVQDYISRRLSDDAYPSDKKGMLFDVIAASPVKKIPQKWIEVFRDLLKKGDNEVKSRVLGVVQSRSVKELNQQVQQIIFDANVAPELKLKAYAARIASDPLLTAKEFDVLLPYLSQKYQPPVRQEASRILSSAELSNAQLAVLAKQIPSIDNFILPAVVYSFEGNMDVKTGNALVASLKSLSGELDNISDQDLVKVLKNYPAEVRRASEPVLNALKQKNADRLKQLQATESSLSNGDVGAGRKLFFGKAICSTCHAIANEGNKFAPDLTNIGEIRSQHDILEAIMFPGASFAREHETSKVATKSNTYTGIIKEQYPDAIVIAPGPGSMIRVPRNEIVSIEQQPVSMMPPGLEKELSPQELSDLIAYLVSLPDGASGTIGY